MFAFSQITDHYQIRDYLKKDINYMAYALGDLDSRYVEHTTWLAASRTGEIEGLALIYEGLDPVVLFLAGQLPALSAMLLHGVGPGRIFFTIPPEVESVLHDFYEVEFVHHMNRMRIVPGIFVELSNINQYPLKAQPLTQKDTTHITALHRAAAQVDQRHREDIAFTPDMLDMGYYHGVFDGDELIAVAGTHLVAPEESVVALGNVVVHPLYRRKGLGGLVSYAVTKALIEAEFKLIVLNVRQNNTAAIKIYRKLGYRQVATFIEGIAVRR